MEIKSTRTALSISKFILLKPILFLLLNLLLVTTCLAQSPSVISKITSYNTNTPFTCITVDTNNNVWAGTDKLGLFKLDQGKDQPATSFDKITIGSRDVGNFTINALAIDSSANLWIGHAGRGGFIAAGGGAERVNFNNPSDAKHYYPDKDIKCLSFDLGDGLPTLNVQSITVDKNGTVWTAHDWDVLNNKYFAPGALAYKQEFAFSFTSKGAWGNRSKSPELPYPNYTCSPSPSQTAQGRTFYAIASNQEVVWASSHPYEAIGGVSYKARILEYDLGGRYRGEITYQTIGIDATYGVFNGIYFSDCGKDWVTLSSTLGFAVRDNQEWNHVPFDSLKTLVPSGTRINQNAIWGNAYGQVFIGTNKGLLVYVGGSILKADSYNFYSTANGLTSNNIISGHTERDSVQWVATDQGIMRLILKEAKPTITIYVELAASKNDRPDEVELWGRKGSATEKIIWDEKDDKKGKIIFNIPTCDQFDVSNLYLMKNGKLYGKTSFSFSTKNHIESRKKEMLVFVHNDLVKYKDHPLEKLNDKWEFKQYFRFDVNSAIDRLSLSDGTNGGDFYQVSALVPPPDFDQKSYALDNINPNNQPVLFIHGYTGGDGYWGADEDIFDSDKDDIATTTKKDYLYTSYPSRLKHLNSSVDVWEFIYPYDQAWKESAYLLRRALQFLKPKYSEKIDIVAHSMGGLVTRCYVEQIMQNYKADGTLLRFSVYQGELRQVTFLGTPHHGSFGSNKLFYGIYLPDAISGVLKDNFSPAAREMSVGSKDLMLLNNKAFDTKGVKYFQISGSTARGLVPFIPKTNYPVSIESWKNSDGIVSISSASLLEYGIPLHLLKGFSHDHLRNADAEIGFEEIVERKSYIPKIINSITESQQVNFSNIGFKTFMPNQPIVLDNIFDFESHQQPYTEKANLDVGMPMVTFKKEDGSNWIPWEGNLNWWEKLNAKINFRFKLTPKKDATGKDVLVLVQEQFWDPLNQNEIGMFLYFGGNYFTFYNDYKEEIPYQLSAFYPYRVGSGGINFLLPESQWDFVPILNLVTAHKKLKKWKKTIEWLEEGKDVDEIARKLSEPNPLNPDFKIEGTGVGWHLPKNINQNLPVHFTYKIPHQYHFTGGYSFNSNIIYYKELNHPLSLKRLTTTYNNLTIPNAALPIFNANQVLNKEIPGSLKDINFRNTLTEMIASSRNEETELQNWVDCNTISTSFVLNYGDNPNPSFELIDPEGNTIGVNNLSPNMYFREQLDERLKYFTINNPKEGLWKVKVDGQEELPNEDYLISYPMSVNNPAFLEPNADNINGGVVYDSVLFEAYLLDPEIPVENLNIIAKALKNDGTESLLDFNDEGLRGDKNANDGIFSGVFYPKDSAEYRIIIDLYGKMDGCNFIREAYYDLESRVKRTIGNDAGIIEVKIPEEACGAKKPIQVVLGNFDGDTYLENVDINWSINGVAQAVFQWEGLINGANDTLITLDSLLIDADGEYEIITWTSLPNGLEDNSTLNDSSALTQELTIIETSDISFQNLKKEYCINEGVITLEATVEGGVFSGLGIVDSSLDLTTAGVGVHDITYTLTNGNCIQSITESINIQDIPSSDFDYQLKDLEVNFVANENDTLSTLIWDFGNGSQSNEPQPIHTYAEFGTYEVCLTVKANCGENSICQSIEIIDKSIQSFALSGSIAKENNQPISNVTVHISDKSTLTDNNGNYSESLLGRENYTIKPTRTDKALNGLSISDLIFVHGAILGRRQLDSPYKIIAADVNNTGTITISDLLEIQEIVLGEKEQFSASPSWKFIPKDYQFSEPTNPLAAPFPDSINIADLAEAKPNLDFIAIKMGDVNLTASNEFSDQESESRSTKKLNIEIQDQKVENNSEIVVPIIGEAFQNSLGYQLGIAYDQEKLELIEILPMVPNGFDFKAENGLIKIIWLSPDSEISTDIRSKQETLLKLRFKSKSTVQLSEILQLSKMFTSKTVGQDLVENSIQLSWTNVMAKSLMVKVFPNPANHQIQIEWTTIDEALSTQIEVYNNLGQNVLSHKVHTGGLTTIDVFQLTSGLYYIRLHQKGKIGHTNFIKVK